MATQPLEIYGAGHSTKQCRFWEPKHFWKLDLAKLRRKLMTISSLHCNGMVHKTNQLNIESYCLLACGSVEHWVLQSFFLFPDKGKSVLTDKWSDALERWDRYCVEWLMPRSQSGKLDVGAGKCDNTLLCFSTRGAFELDASPNFLTKSTIRALHSSLTWAH